MLEEPVKTSILYKELAIIKERLNDAEKKLSDFSEILKAQADIEITELEIQNVEAEQALTDVEIELAELTA